MAERIYREINRSFGVDTNACFRYGDQMEKKLEPAVAIGDKNLCLGVLENSILKPPRLLLFGKDREPIRVSIPSTNDIVEIAHPGKSALVVLQPNLCDRQSINDIVITIFGKTSTRYLHVATVGEIEDAGWIPYYAPLQLRGLMDHVRMVAKRTLESSEDPTMEDAENLTKVLTRV